MIPSCNFSFSSAVDPREAHLVQKLQDILEHNPAPIGRCFEFVIPSTVEVFDTHIMRFGTRVRKHRPFLHGDELVSNVVEITFQDIG